MDLETEISSIKKDLKEIKDMLKALLEPKESKGKVTMKDLMDALELLAVTDRAILQTTGEILKEVKSTDSET